MDGTITIVISGWHFIWLVGFAGLWLIFSLANEVLTLYKRYLERKLRLLNKEE